MKALNGRMRGIEMNARSRSPDVYLTVRVWPKLALYVKALRHPAFQPTIEDVVIRAVQEAVLREFGISGGDIGRHVSSITDREALMELLDAS